MRCEYCDVEVTTYPDNGICVYCGGRLPPKPAVEQKQPAQTVYIPVQQPSHHPGFRCPKCGSSQIITVKRGFSWGVGILCFFLIPVYGLLLGFLGFKKPRYKCTACGRKWKPV